MAKKLCLVLSALSLIPAQVFGYGGYYGNGDGSTTFSNGRLTTHSKSNHSGTSSSSSRSTTAFSSARSGSGARGFSGGGRGFSGAGGGGGGFGASAFGSSATPSHTTTTTQAATASTVPTAEGALARSPGMFTQKQPSSQPQTWFSGATFTGVAMEDSKAQPLGGAGLGQYVGPADLAQGQTGSSQSGPYNGSLYSNNNSAAGH